MAPQTRWRLLGWALIVWGLANSAYLLTRTWGLLADRGPGTIDVCSAVFGTGCDATLLSESSWQLGIPLAGWGLVFYCTLAGLLGLAWWLGAAFNVEATLAALVIALLGACASLILAAVMLAGWAPLCPLCLVIHVINLALPPILWRSGGRTTRELFQVAKAGMAYLVGRESEGMTDAPWKVVGFLAAGLVAVVAYQWIYVESALRRAAAANDPKPADVLRAYLSSPKQDLPIDADDARLGPADAPVCLVVFMSFQCPACAEFAKELRPLRAEFGDKLCIVVKHFPLGRACNPALKTDKQPRSCEAALAAEAARRQDQFWPVHDALFQADLEAAGDTLVRIAQEIGLDLPRFNADRAAPETAAKVRADIELATRLGVAETPAVFLNKHRLHRFSPAILRVLIAHELQAHP
jgi:Protein-disulfide isomerase